VWRTIKINGELIRVVKEIWLSLPLHYIQSLYASIPRWLRHVIQSKGHATKYYHFMRELTLWALRDVGHFDDTLMARYCTLRQNVQWLNK
jgi:hypothetical protein